jgi:predicted CoA-binding protein
MDDVIEALRNASTIAVVGLDSREDRPARRVAAYLQRVGYRIIPVHRNVFPADEILGEKAYASLLDIPEQVGLVDVFVRSEQTGPIIDDAIAIGAGAIWLQKAIKNDEGLAKARLKGIPATQDRCTMIEHKTLVAAA